MGAVMMIYKVLYVDYIEVKCWCPGKYFRYRKSEGCLPGRAEPPKSILIT